MKPIPVAVIGGYLGAGKTTLLNALLRNANGVRYAVLVNDFGSVNIDGELIASAGTQAIELTNGCICCTIGGDLILALKALLTRDPVPERIVIEASGVADPRAIARLAACHPALHVQGTIVVADAETIVDRADDKYVGGLVRRQLGAGDAIILNKIDLIGEDRLTAVRQWISVTNPGVPVFESSIAAGFPVDIVFDSDLAGLREESEEPSGVGDDVTFRAVTYRSAHPFDRARFIEAVQGMLPAIARAKGTLYFADDPDTRYLFQLSGERWSVEPFPPAEPQRQTKIVAIAVAEREASSKRRSRHCGEPQGNSVPASACLPTRLRSKGKRGPVLFPRGRSERSSRPVAL